MANNTSAKKRIIITKRNNIQNRFYKSSVKTLTKKFLKDLEIYNFMSFTKKWSCFGVK